MFNRGMLRGNWSSIRGAAPVGLGALGRHDARLQGLAGWLASSLAHTLCMFSPLCQLVTMSDVSLVRELRARGRRLMERTQQLLLASESGVTLSAIHYWQRWAILVICSRHFKLEFKCRWTHSMSRGWRTSNPPTKSFFRSRSNFTKRYKRKIFTAVILIAYVTDHRKAAGDPEDVWSVLEQETTWWTEVSLSNWSFSPQQK